MWLTRLALRNPVLILMMSLMLVVLGVLSLKRLAVDLFPPIDIPVVRVATFYSGAGPEEIEQSITQPIERAVAASPGVERVESTSKQGVSVVSVWFTYGTNVDTAQFEVSQRVAQVLNTLPAGIQQPFVIKFDVTNIPVAQVAIESDSLDERALYDLATNVIQPQIERIAGVASSSVGGGRQREIGVRVNRDRLRARGLSILDVVNTVRNATFLMPSGSLRAGTREYNVSANTQVDGAHDLAELILPSPSGVPTVRATDTGASQLATRLADVAQVEDGVADQSNIVRVNGRRGVTMRVLKQPGANTIAVVDALRATLPRLRAVPDGVKLSISFDQSGYIRAAITSLEHEAVQGGVLAVLVILAFLVSLRGTIIVAIAIPLSIVATFLLLYVSGQSLNIFTLGGLALGVGRLVDDSIVELENIHRHMEHTPDRKKAVLDAAGEVAMPILVSTITTIVVFFPVLFLEGVSRNLFIPLAVTISFALIMSFVVSRTVTPLLCLHVMKPSAPRGFSRWWLARLDALDNVYASVLRWVLRHRFVTIVAILGVSSASLLLVPRIGTEFFPEADEGQVNVTFRTPIGTRVEKTEEVAVRVENAVSSTLGAPTAASSSVGVTISDVGLSGGRTALFTANTGSHAGSVQINLVGARARTRSDVQAGEALRAALRDALPGVQVFVSTGGILKRILNFGAPAPVDVEVLGQDLEASTRYARVLLAKLRALKASDGGALVSDLQLSREENAPELRVRVDRQRAGLMGVSERDVAQTVLASLVGNQAFAPIPFADPRTGNESFVNVRFADKFRSAVSDLGDAYVRSPRGGLINLRDLATIERVGTPVLIGRRYMQRVVDITGNVAAGRDLGTVGDAVQQVLDKNPPPDGVTVQLGGQVVTQRQAFAGLRLAGILALVLVYMVLASQFSSLRDPLVIMLSVPLGIAGVIVTLYLTRTTLSVNSFMGVIMMVGIVVSNGVLLVDFANVLRQRGHSLVDATIEAGRTRLRPILMTTLATVVGLIPMALGIGEGSETNLPLARAVIGGLTASTLFTLFLVPALYTLVTRRVLPAVETEHTTV